MGVVVASGVGCCARVCSALCARDAWCACARHACGLSVQLSWVMILRSALSPPEYPSYSSYYNLPAQTVLVAADNNRGNLSSPIGSYSSTPPRRATMELSRTEFRKGLRGF
jgi:hypothetical protein